MDRRVVIRLFSVVPSQLASQPTPAGNQLHSNAE